MKVRGIVYLLLTLCAFAAGCGSRQEDEYVLSDRTASLIPEARKPVTDVLEASFGHPSRLVAWLELPVDFGHCAGVVADPADIPETERGRKIKVTLDVPKSAAGPSSHSSLAGLGVFWLSGSQAVTDGEVTPTTPFPGIHVSSFDESSQVLTLVERMESAPQPGDRFWVVGHRFQEGAVLFRQNCLRCHGLTGDGNGPDASGLNPLPRDYRLGLFKFTSTKPTERIARTDLSRTVRSGIPGTAMPVFETVLDDDQLASVVEYVRWLAMRGELENKLALLLTIDYSSEAVKERLTVEDMKSVLADLRDYITEFFVPEDIPAEVDVLAETWKRADEPSSRVVPGREQGQTLEELVQWFDRNRDGLDALVRWCEANRDKVKSGELSTDEYPESVLRLIKSDADFTKLVQAARDGREATRSQLDEVSLANGRRIYLGDEVKCYACHGETGHGDGPQTKEFQMISGQNEMYPDPGLYDDWGHKIHPNDLTQGTYRAGKQPIDIYRRIYSGIKATPMSSFATTLTDDDIWDLVNYTLSLSSAAPQ